MWTYRDIEGAWGLVCYMCIRGWFIFSSPYKITSPGFKLHLPEREPPSGNGLCVSAWIIVQ